MNTRWPALVVAVLLLAFGAYLAFNAVPPAPAHLLGATTPTPRASPASSAAPAATPASTATPNLLTAISSIRTCLNQPGLVPVLKSTGRSSTYPSVVLEFYEAGRYDVEVETQTHQVTGISRSAESVRVGSTPTFDLTPRYTPEQLQDLARAFIARCAGTPLDALTPNHNSSDSLSYFFRWEDRTRLLGDGVPPFIEAGFLRSGELVTCRNWLVLAPLAKLVTPLPTANGTITRICWSVQSPVPTPTPGHVPVYGTRVPMRSALLFPCNATPVPADWRTYSSTGINQGNRGLLDAQPDVKAPLLTFRFPATWKLANTPTGYGGGNQAYLDFALTKHQPGIPDNTGEGPGVSDVRVEFGLLLVNASPYDFYETSSFGPSASGMVIEHGTFNGYPALFASIGNPPNGIQRQLLIQAAPGVLVSILADFPGMQGASSDYIRQTLAEMDGIFSSVVLARVGPR